MRQLANCLPVNRRQITSKQDTQTLFAPVTLTLPDDLDTLTWPRYSEVYLHTKNDLSRLGRSNVRALQSDKQTGTTENITTQHSPVLVVGRRSLAGELSPSSARHAADRW